MGAIDYEGVPLESGRGNLYLSEMGRGWRGVGTVVPDKVQTTAEFIEAAGLDWTVKQPKLSEYVPFKGAERFVVNVREDTDELLGVLGSKWRSPSNREAFEFVDDILDSGEAKWLAGGTLEKGRTVFGVAQLQRDMLIGDDGSESIIPLLFFRNGWDGGTALTVDVAPFRKICTNGLTIPVADARRSIKLRHTGTINGRMMEVRKTLELSIAYLGEFEAEMEKLVQTPYSESQWQSLVQRLIPLPVADTSKEDGGIKMRRAKDARTLLSEVYHASGDLDAIRGTRYGALNAVAEYADWHAGVRQPSEERRFVRAMDDTGGKIKTRAAQLLRV